MIDWFTEYFFKKNAEKRRFAKRIQKADPLKIIIGSGGIAADADWISTDINILDVTKEDQWRYLLKSRRADNVFAEHVWEHLTFEQADSANLNIYNFLKKNGKFRVAVPDGFKPDEYYINYVKPGGCGAGADDHKVLYNYRILSQRLENAGFQVNLLEYWDESGHFNYSEWDPADGKVLRSRFFDTRNRSGELKYTSLIADAIKV